MQAPNTEGAAELQRLPGRGIVRRLWESYAKDLAGVLNEAQAGHLSEPAAHLAIGKLACVMQSLRQDGPLSQTLRRAELVMVNAVLKDVQKSEDR